MYVCLQQLNWRHPNYYMEGNTVKNTNNLRLSDMTGNIIFDSTVTGAISSLFLFNCESMNLKGCSENGNILSCTCLCVCFRQNEMGKNKHTVRIVGVTKAQQSLQNRLGWKPIIISMSSQNLCRPAKKKEQKWNKRREMATTQTEETQRVTWV